MSNYTDEQLKRALAKMLPERIAFGGGYRPIIDYLCWLPIIEGKEEAVLYTELLHICSLVEQGLCGYTGEHGEEYSQCDDYAKELMKLCGTWSGSGWDWGSVCNADLFKAAHATWQQRVIALASVKGIEIL